MTAAERAEPSSCATQRQIDDEVLDEMLRQLDLEEAMLSRDEWDITGGDEGRHAAPGPVTRVRRGRIEGCDSLPGGCPPDDLTYDDVFMVPSRSAVAPGSTSTWPPPTAPAPPSPSWWPT